MKKEIDLIAYLRNIVAENTTAYQSDFRYDEAIFRNASKAPRTEDRTFYWMSRPNGTWCVREREVFLRDTSAFQIWTYYDRNNQDFKAFRVNISGMYDTQVTGSVLPICYSEQIERIKRFALPVVRVYGTFHDGIPFDLSPEQMTWQVKCQHHGVKEIHYEPQNELELQNLIQKEHTIQEKQSKNRGKKKILER